MAVAWTAKPSSFMPSKELATHFSAFATHSLSTTLVGPWSSRVKSRLVNVLRRCPGIDLLAAAGGELPSFDVQAPLQRLPLMFKTRLETIPANVPYLFADPGLIES